MQNSVNTAREPLTEIPPTSSKQPFASTVTSTNYRGHIITLANIIKTYCLTLPPICDVDERGKLIIDTSWPVTLTKPDWWEIADTAMCLAKSVIPAGECLWALRHVAPYLSGPLALAGTSLLPGATAKKIDVPDFETLAQIGKNDSLRLDGNYQQTARISAAGRKLTPIGNDDRPFTGTYDGNNKIITGLSDCLFGTVNNGTVANLKLKKANITKTHHDELAAVVACNLKNHGRIANITVKDSVIHTSGSISHAAIGAGKVTEFSKIENLDVTGCNVSTTGNSTYAAIGVADIVQSSISNLYAGKCQVSSSGSRSPAAIGVGYMEKDSKILGLTARASNVSTTGFHSKAGIGSAQMHHQSTIGNLDARKCAVSTSGESSHGAIGAGIMESGSSIYNQVSVKCNVTTGNDVNVDVSKDGMDAFAGIGVGQMGSGTRLENLKATRCFIHTHGDRGYAGVGAGEASHGAILSDTKVNQCSITTERWRAHVGFGAGFTTGAAVIDTTVFNSTAQVKGDAYACIDTSAGIAGCAGANVKGTIACNVTINDRLFTPSHCDCIDLEGFKNGSSLRHDPCPQDTTSSLPPAINTSTPPVALTTLPTTVTTLTTVPAGTTVDRQVTAGSSEIIPSSSNTFSSAIVSNSTTAIAPYSTAGIHTPPSPRATASIVTTLPARNGITPSATAATVPDSTNGILKSTNISLYLIPTLTVAVAAMAITVLAVFCLRRKRQNQHERPAEMIELNNLRPIPVQEPTEPSRSNVRYGFNLLFTGETPALEEHRRPITFPEDGRPENNSNEFAEKVADAKWQLRVSLPSRDSEDDEKAYGKSSDGDGDGEANEKSCDETEWSPLSIALPPKTLNVHKQHRK